MGLALACGPAALQRCIFFSLLRPTFSHVPNPLGQVLVATLDGTKRPVSVPSSSSIAQLQGEVQRAAGIPPDRQRLLVLEQRPLGRPQRLLRGLLRLLVAAALWLLCWLAAAGRWALRLPPPPAGVQLVLRTESGMSVELAVPPDTTLQQLQTIIYERHGEQLSLQHLWVGAQREGSSSPKWSGAQHGFATGREP